MTVWKFEIPLSDVSQVTMPKGAKLLHVGTQKRDGLAFPFVWALVDPTATYVLRHFRLAGTGHEIDPEHQGPHVGSFAMHGGAIVFHLFDCGENR